MPAELEYKITKACGVLSTSARGWTKELNYVSCPDSICASGAPLTREWARV